MNLSVEEIRTMFGRGDAERDKGLKTPENIKRYDNIPYGDNGKFNLLDVYHVNGIKDAQPTIISIHGGAWVYGMKEVYQYYCMSLAQKGFTVVNFSYRLAPEDKFPCALEDVNNAFLWVKNNYKKYNINLNNIFVVGDSCGAQIASQYLAMLTNSNFAKLFDFKLPDIKVQAVALNCGIYNVKPYVENSKDPMVEAYIGDKKQEMLPLLDTMKYVNKDFPSSYIMTAYYDFLKENAKPMYDYLTSLGIDCEYKMYGNESRQDIAHVFHCNVKIKEAQQCNEDECNFFKKFIK